MQPRSGLPSLTKGMNIGSAWKLDRARQGEEDATLQARPAAVRSGGPSEARPLRAALTGRSGSATPKFLVGGWGEPEPGCRELQQRGEAAGSGTPRPDWLHMAHTTS